MATSDKLTYLANTKGLIKTAINNAGANITNDTFRSYATTLGNRITKMHTDYETALSYLPMDTKTNTSVSITDAVDLPTYSFKLTKESTQSGTPTPSNPIEVNTVKGYRNLLNLSQFEDQEISGITFTKNSDNSITISGTSEASFNLDIPISDISLANGETYYISQSNTYTGSNYQLSLRKGDTGAVSSNGGLDSGTSGKSFTMTSDETAKYFRIYVVNEKTINTTIYPMFVKGNEQLPYVPYGTNWIYTTITDGTNTKQILLPLNDNVIAGIDDYKDEYIVDKNGHCYLNKKIGKVVLDGSEEWTYKDTDETNYCFSRAFSGYYKNDTSLTSGYGLSNYFNVGTKYGYNAALQAGIGIYFYPSTSNVMYLVTNTATTVSQLELWLNNHNTEIYYPLATANLIDLNYFVDMTLYEGTNTITNSETAPMEITYVEDINTILATLFTPSVSE